MVAIFYKGGAPDACWFISKMLFGSQGREKNKISIRTFPSNSPRLRRFHTPKPSKSAKIAHWERSGEFWRVLERSREVERGRGGRQSRGSTVSIGRGHHPPRRSCRHSHCPHDRRPPSHRDECCHPNRGTLRRRQSHRHRLLAKKTLS